MKLAVIYDSTTGNTKQAAEWIVEGMNQIEGIESRAFPIHDTDEAFVKEACGLVVGSPSYAALMTPDMHAWLLSSAGKLGFAGKEDAAADHERMKNGVMEEVKRIFRPEFLNRIDETIVFHALNKENMKQIFSILLKQMNKSFQESHGIHLTVSAAARDALTEKGYDPKY